MALTACRECGRPVAPDVRVCPGCGTRTPTVEAADRRADVRFYLPIVAIVLAGTAIAGYEAWHQHQQDECIRDQADAARQGALVSGDC